MAPRGGWRGGGRPPKTEGEKRKHFGCRIKSSNLKWITQERERTGKSAGEIVDHLIETHRPADRLPDNPQEEADG